MLEKLYMRVNCRIGSLEMWKYDGVDAGAVNCRIGSLEMPGSP